MLEIVKLKILIINILGANLGFIHHGMKPAVAACAPAACKAVKAACATSPKTGQASPDACWPARK